MMINKNKQNLMVVGLFLTILLLDTLSLKHKTLTDDEANYHLPYGLNILKLNSDRLPFDAESVVNGTMPFTALNVIPARIGATLNNGNLRHFFAQLNTARLVTILSSLVLAFYVFHWAKQLYGVRAGLISLFIYAFSPNIIAHSQLVTTDMYAAGMMTISCYYFWRLVKFGGWTRATICAVIVGIAQLTKYACLMLYPLFALILLARFSGDIVRLARENDFKALRKGFVIFLGYASFFVIISLVIINMGFLFNRSFTPLGEYKFRSDSFKTFQAKHPGIGHLSVPLPYPYLEGIDGHQFDEQKGGKQHGLLYLMGKLKKGGGFKGYFFITYLYKEPIASQLLLILALAAYLWKRKRYNFRENEAFLLVPIVVSTIYLNFFFTMHIGIRHFLFVFPFIYIFCGSLFKNWEALSLKFKRTIIFLFIYLVVSVLSYFPHFLSYFNELVWDRKMAYKILADSNINWGQNRWYLKKYLEKHPEVIVQPEYPVSGRIVVEVNHLAGIFYPEKYKWLRENFKPVDHIAYTYLLYDILPEDLEKIR